MSPCGGSGLRCFASDAPSQDGAGNCLSLMPICSLDRPPNRAVGGGISVTVMAAMA